MLPIRDHNPSEKIPFVTYALIAANILIFVSYWGNMANDRVIMAFFDDWAFTPATFSEGDDRFGLISSMYLHGSFTHLAGNMLFLWIFGDNLEEEFGHVGFFVFYTVCGIAATLAHWLAVPWSEVPLVGASGAIAGVMGGYLLLFPKARVDILFIFLIFFRIIALPAWILLGMWFLMQLAIGIGTGTNGAGVAYWAHAGGFIVGFVLTLPAFQKRGATAYWTRTEGRPPHPDAQYRWAKTRVPVVRRGERGASRIPRVRRQDRD